ncbi:MAG: hypothetical protein NTW96_24495 [Planctomycetia bacterium]|nr:hypothetical protein [Planctomycetia bacterium]
MKVAMTDHGLPGGVGKHEVLPMTTLLYDIWQLADKLSADWHQDQEWVQYGVLPRPVYVGEYARWRASDVEAWANSSCPTTQPMDDDEDLVFLEALVAELRDYDERKGIAV